jgi:hypothetical protein
MGMAADLGAADFDRPACRCRSHGEKRKRLYLSRRAAAQAVEAMRVSGVVGARSVYPCPTSSGYHLTSMAQSSRTADRLRRGRSLRA